MNKLWKQVKDQRNKLENGKKLKMKLKIYYVHVEQNLILRHLLSLF